MKKLFFNLLLLLNLLIAGFSVDARGVYQEPADFVAEAFAEVPPERQTLWITSEMKQDVRDILGHDYKSLRVKYWFKDGRSVWILEEIGKEHYITTGFIINDNVIDTVRVLIFRESRGWEVRHSFFTNQFKGAGLKKNKHYKLDRNIDNITGATLSVRALKKLARLALYFHNQHVAPQNSP